MLKRHAHVVVLPNETTFHASFIILIVNFDQ